MKDEESMEDEEDDWDVSVVWRVIGEDFDVDAFLARFPVLSPGLVWRKGDVGRRGPPSETSGFNETLGECRRAEVPALLQDALDAYQDELEAARRETEHLVHLGLMVPVDSLVSGVTLEPPLLKRLAELELKVIMSV